MLRNKYFLLSVAFVLLLAVLGTTIYAITWTQGVTSVSSSSVKVWFKPSATCSYVILHYTVTGQAQQNINMTYNSGAAQWEYTITGLASGNVITYSFTYNTGGLQYDTGTYTYTVGSVTATPTATKTPTVTPGVTPTATRTPSGGSNSVFSVAYSSIPAPGSSGGVSFTLLNGTNGVYSNSQVYWGVLGINPSTGKWCYLDLNGNLQPISNALNDASGHLTKNGQNYANIYFTIAQKQWITIPQITSGRMYLSVGGPCYIKTYDTGFAGPDINNGTDPNLNVYFDFIEFTINGSGYHGNTTRVDMFGFPIQHRLVNNGGSYDKTVGELESETRSGLFTKYQNEVPSQFKSLGTDQQPYRIIAPIHGSFKAGGANANYFAGYSSISTQDILMGVGGAADPGTCAALNRHVYTLSNWNNVADYYKAAPANYYAKFFHDHSYLGWAYGFCYDDVNGQAAYLEVGSPKGLIIRVGW